MCYIVIYGKQALKLTRGNLRGTDATLSSLRLLIEDEYVSSMDINGKLILFCATNEPQKYWFEIGRSQGSLGFGNMESLFCMRQKIVPDSTKQVSQS